MDQVDESSKNDVEEMKFCSLHAHKKKGYGTIRPRDEDEEWGCNIFKSTTEGGDGYIDYVQTNSFTNEGLDEIARYNGYAQDWEIQKKAFKKDAPVADKRWMCFLLYAANRKKRKVHLDPFEGGHRKVGMIQATFCAAYDVERASITEPNSLTVQHFQSSGLQPKNDENESGTTSDHMMRNYYWMAKDAEQDKGFFCRSQTVRVRYLKSFTTPVKKFLESCRQVSNMCSRRKRQSATKDPFVEIATHVHEYMMSASPNALANSPDLSNFAYPGAGKFPAAVPKKELQNVNCNWKSDPQKLEEILPLTSVLYEEVYIDYVKDPFSKEKERRILERFESPRLMKDNDGNHATDDDMKLKPPYVVGWDEMSVHPYLGEKLCATARMINTWMLGPKVAQIIFSADKNKSLNEIAEDEDVHKVLLYVMRHHVHNCSTRNLSSQACMQAIYKMTYKPCLATESDDHVVFAMLYITEMANAALTDKSLTDPERGRESLERVGKEVADIITSFGHRAGYPHVRKITKALCKHCLCKILLHFVNIFSDTNCNAFI